MTIYKPYTRQQMEQYWEESEKQVAAERERQARRVNLSKLTEGQKRKVWEHLKKEQPGLAALMKEPMLQETVKLFDADIYLDIQMVIDALGHAP